ncbi:MAG TPA: sugar ABC transporter substrate-binding protein [Thermoanaerobaculaceae bacterium]|nr:sugar ABC transporter substrate-binding protein [Thermoanaerobaculaceae bacterium]
MAKVVVALQNERQEFQLLEARVARESAARGGLDIEVVFADDNAIQQIHQLFAYIRAPEDARPAALIVQTVGSEGFERVARNAVKAGIGWVLINRTGGYLDALRAERRDLPIASVSVDNEEVGAIQGRQLRALLPGGGSVLYLQGPADTSTARDRLLHAQKAIAGSPIELKVLASEAWMEASGERAVSAWLRLKSSEGSRPVAVCAQNDTLSVGARRAILAHRPEWSDLVFTGCNGSPDYGQRLVQSGELTATIVTPPPTASAVELVSDVLAGKPARDLRVRPRSHPPEEELSRHARPAAAALAEATTPGAALSRPDPRGPHR